MTTQFIGVKEFRANLATFHKKALKGNLQFIVLSRSKPLFKVSPLTPEERFYSTIEEAKQQVKRGEVYTSEEVEKMLGL